MTGLCKDCGWSQNLFLDFPAENLYTCKFSTRKLVQADDVCEHFECSIEKQSKIISNFVNALNENNLLPGERGTYTLMFSCGVEKIDDELLIKEPSLRFTDKEELGFI